MEEKKEQLAVILSKAKDASTNGLSTVRSFSLELIEKDTQDSDSILFNSLNEAVNIIAEFAGRHLKRKITKDILSHTSPEELWQDPSVRLRIVIS